MEILVFMRSSMNSSMSTFSIKERLHDLSKEVADVSDVTIVTTLASPLKNLANFQF